MNFWQNVLSQGWDAAEADNVVGLLDRANAGPQFKNKNPKLGALPMIYDPRSASLPTTTPPPPSAPPPMTPPPRQPPRTMMADANSNAFSPGDAFSPAATAGMNAQSGAKPTASGANWAAALGMASKMASSKPKDEGVKPPSIPTPSPLRANPIQGSLPDPVLFALFGRPI